MKRNYPIYFVPKGSMLTFIKMLDKSVSYRRMALYKCSCGKTKEAFMHHVKSGNVKSCGCLVQISQSKKVMSKKGKENISFSNTTHGLSRHTLYKILCQMIRRCYVEKDPSYRFYGAKCVKVCDEWKNNPEAFIFWAENNGWKPGLRVDKDKIPKELGIPAILYSPEMCSILTPKENNNIHGGNKILEYMGKKQTLSQWADEYGIKYKTFQVRIKQGCPIERALLSQEKYDKIKEKRGCHLILNTQTGIFYYGVREAANSASMKGQTLYGKICSKTRPNNTSFIKV